MSQFNNVSFHQLAQNPAQTKSNLEETTNPEDNLTNTSTDRSKFNVNYKQILGLLLGLTHYIIAGITSGYASVVIAQEGNKITESESSWIASIFAVPMAPATLICGFVLTKMKKKSVLITITIFEIISWLIMYFSTSISTILIGRVISGMTNGMGSPIIPPFLGEISRPSMRGLYLCMVLLGISLGLLIIHILGAFFTWNMCALITAVITTAYFCLGLYLPETYAWYLRNDEIPEAKTAFLWYRGESENSIAEFDKLLVNQHERVSNNYTKKQIAKLCCTKFMLMPLAITLVAMITMHLSGIKVIMFYSISIVSQVIPSLDKYTSTIIVDVIRILMTCIGCVLIRKFSIRPLFIISGIGSAVSHVCFSAFYKYSENETGQIFSILALIALISHTVFSSIGISPLPWVIAGEIFPLILKGIASGVCCFVYFFVMFVVIKLTPELFAMFGISGGFLFFAGCTTIGTCIMYFILPETKNKTLKEIEDLFR